MKEGIEALERRLRERAGRMPGAFAAAGFTLLHRVLDRVRPTIPRRTGELADSGFLMRTDPVVGGWSAAHAAPVHELDAGRGFKFHQREFMRALPGWAAEQAQLAEQYADAGVTLTTVSSSYPEEPPPGRPRSPTQRVRRPARRQRAGAVRAR